MFEKKFDKRGNNTTLTMKIDTAWILAHYEKLSITQREAERILERIATDFESVIPESVPDMLEDVRRWPTTRDHLEKIGYTGETWMVVPQYFSDDTGNMNAADEERYCETLQQALEQYADPIDAARAMGRLPEGDEQIERRIHRDYWADGLADGVGGCAIIWWDGVMWNTDNVRTTWPDE